MSASPPADALSDPPPPDPLPEGRFPVDIRLEVAVGAAPDEVWAVLSRIGEWPRWHRGIQVAVLRGELEPGTRLDWRADGIRIRSVVREVEPATTLGLTLRMLGGRGYARWTLEPRTGATRAGSGTLVRVEEVWEGIAVSVLRRTLRRTLRVSRTAWLEALRDRVEGRWPEG